MSYIVYRRLLLISIQIFLIFYVIDKIKYQYNIIFKYTRVS